jgi:ubiquinone/menaquinone biosynthesis C-methylase UbiE
VTVSPFDGLTCRGRRLTSRLRYRLSPPRREVDPLQIRPGQTIADVGAGLGYHTAEILSRLGGAGRVYAIDHDPRHLDRMRARLLARGPRDDLEILLTSATQLGAIRSESVDAALLSLVLCCVVDKKGTMDEVWRILRPGGRAVATFPRFGLSFNRWKRALRMRRRVMVGLMNAHPWTLLAPARGLLVRRFVLGKP